MKYWLLVIIQMFTFIQAAQLKVSIVDENKRPLPDVVVALELMDNSQSIPITPKDKVISQINHTFEPFVTIVNVGSKIQFPNYDLTAHHVYSFSPAKTFELKLYTKMPDQDVMFDIPGTVKLACGIHDNMEAYVYVSDKPYAELTNRYGEVSFKGVKAGNYQLSLWHPYDEAPYESKEIQIIKDQRQSIELTYEF